MISCCRCKHRNCPQYCACCVGWSHYESDTLINPVLAMDIDKEMKMLAKHKHTLNKMFGLERLERRENNMTIKKVYFNDPVTVILWEDGTKTIVKSGDYDVYDPEKGLAMAIAKKALGNQGNYYEVFKKWLPEEEEIKELPESLKKLIDKRIIKSESIHNGDGIKTTITEETIKEVKRLEDEVQQIQWLSAKKVAEANGLSVECVRKQIKNGLIPLAEKVNGKWKIPCYVFDDHVEVKCM